MSGAGALVPPSVRLGLRTVVAEIGVRMLGHRQRVRTGAVVQYAGQRYKELRADGQSVRDDGFFDDLPAGRNAGREIAEGVLLAAGSAYEERKVRHLGYLLANVAFDSGIDASLAHYALRTARELSWRQYVPRGRAT